MEVMIGVMIALMVLMSFGLGHGPMAGSYESKTGQTQESATPAGGKNDCRQCPKEEKMEKADEKPAN